MFKAWTKILPFGLVVWFARKNCSIYPYNGDVVEVYKGIYVSVDKNAKPK